MLVVSIAIIYVYENHTGRINAELLNWGIHSNTLKFVLNIWYLSSEITICSIISPITLVLIHRRCQNNYNSPFYESFLFVYFIYCNRNLCKFYSFFEKLFLNCFVHMALFSANRIIKYLFL